MSASLQRLPFRFAIAVLAAVTWLSGCVVQETRPQARVEARQAVQEIPTEQRLDVVVRAFDPGVPAELAADEEALAKKRIYPELRKAEARYFAVMLRNTLEGSAQWGAVRVAPENVQFVDVAVSGRIIESTGKRLVLDVTARDAAGRIWLDARRYSAEADLGSYKTEATLKARDPFQNLYSNIANDLLAARTKLDGAALRELRQVTELSFGADLAPAALSGYLQQDARGKPKLWRVVRLPASTDPVAARVQRIRERDTAVIDTLDGYYTGFSEQMQQPYGEFRQTSYEEIDKEDRARASGRTRTVLGAAAVVASILAPGGCSSNASCNLASAARYAGAAGGVAAFLSGLKRYADARTHAQAFGELARSVQADVGTQVVEVEGRSLRLTGTAEEQYREWRALLLEYQLPESPAHGEL
jgi:outer membrane murein-binding lipoprotein Lpp